MFGAPFSNPRRRNRMCSGYCGDLNEAIEIHPESESGYPSECPPLLQQSLSSKAERNIHLCNSDVNI